MTISIIVALFPKWGFSALATIEKWLFLLSVEFITAAQGHTHCTQVDFQCNIATICTSCNMAVLLVPPEGREEMWPRWFLSFGSIKTKQNKF